MFRTEMQLDCLGQEFEAIRRAQSQKSCTPSRDPPYMPPLGAAEVLAGKSDAIRDCRWVIRQRHRKVALVDPRKAKAPPVRYLQKRLRTEKRG